MRDLRLYRQKRDPDRTPEPFGEELPARVLPPAAPRGFVVQQHAARNLHWDLRLEIDGVLVSWAIPKGPSLDPSDKRLAVQTEDHPLEYADFEGVIPDGNYGAGAMIVWDRGVYRNVDGHTPAEALAAGKLDLALSGHKLRGRFALVRTQRGAGRDWLFFHKGDVPEEGADIVSSAPGSVFSGLTVQELADGVSRDAELKELARRGKAPAAPVDAETVRPMLAHTEEQAFDREGWLFELKYDGVRVLAEKRGGEVRLFSRTGRDRTATYPEVATAVSHLPVADCLIDGEVVALDETGRSSFERLQRRFTQTDPGGIEQVRAEIPVVFYAFDCLAAAGRDLRRCRLDLRKQALAAFVPGRGVVSFADHVEGDGVALFEAARAHDLEGIVAKRADSPYESGQRSRRWVKLKVPRSAPLVIVGWVGGRGSRAALGSLMLGWWQGDSLVYAGNVGSGLGEDLVDDLLARFAALQRDTPAFQGAPTAGSRGVTYLEPELVCDVRFTEVTSSGALRHPVFSRLREDLAARDCSAPVAREAVAEAAPIVENPGPDLRLTRLEKVFWPVEGYTKGDLLAYYEAAWPWLEPYLADRPVVLNRYPDGIEGNHFYQRNAPGFTPDWVHRHELDGTDYFLCDDLRTLLYVINSGAIPLHVWSARLADIEHPDWLILDLDPKDAPFADVVRIARHIHRLLDELGARHFVKTSGQDGLHVMLPLAGTLDHAEAKTLGEVLARTVVADLPEIATVTRPIAARGDRVYVDYLQNGRGKLIAAPLSVRPRPGAPVSMPLTWAQVSARLDPARWTIKTALRRLERHGDPFRDVLGEPVDVASLLSALAERARSASDAG